MMKSFLLLVLSLMAGCAADYEVKGCRDGWVEFTCKYPERQRNYQNIVVHGRQIIKSTEKNQWENKGRFSLYHDTTKKHLRVVIKELKHEDFEDYKCEFHSGRRSHFTDQVELKEMKKDCQTPLTQTANRPKTTITCENSEYKKPIVKFFCKEKNGLICEEILSTQSKSNGRFTLTDTNRGFSISISDVSSQDAGVYWCGVKPDGGNYSAAFRRIQLNVQNPTTTSTASITTSVPSVQTTAASAETDDLVSVSTTWTSVSSDQLTTAPAGSNAGSQAAATAAGVCAAVLLVVIVLVLIYKWLKIRRNRGEKQKRKQNKEDHGYAEIQDPPQKTDSGTAMKTVYVTANFPTNPSAFTNYSKITFKSSSDDVNANIYSTVSYDQHATDSTVTDSKPSL